MAGETKTGAKETDWEKVEVVGGVKLTSAERKVLNEVTEHYFSIVNINESFVLNALNLDYRTHRSFVTPRMLAIVKAFTRVAFTQWMAANISNRLPLLGSLKEVRKRLLNVDNEGLVKLNAVPTHDILHIIAALLRKGHSRSRLRADSAVPAFVTSGGVGTFFALLGLGAGTRGPTGADHEREETLAVMYGDYRARRFAKEASSVREFIINCNTEYGLRGLLGMRDRYTERGSRNAWFYNAMKKYYDLHHSTEGYTGALILAEDHIKLMERYLRDVAPGVHIPA